MGGVTGVRVPSDQAFKLVKNLLTEVYRDTDGRTVLRELVQNADDAGASRIEFGLHVGFPSSEHPFLRGPALVVANDGSFRRRDEDAMHQSAGGSKSTDVEKVGRFGLGQKSVFHLCEAFYYVGFSPEDGLTRGGVDPWLADSQGGASTLRGGFDPKHPTSDELAVLDPVRREVLGQESTACPGLMLWIPLRQDQQCGRLKNDRRLRLSSAMWTLGDARGWLDSKRETSFALLLAQAGSLQTIRTTDQQGRELVRVERRGDRFERPPAEQQGHRLMNRGPAWLVFKSAESRVTTVAVVDSEHDTLNGLRDHESWPDDYDRTKDGLVSEPRKAAAHAAVTLLRRRNDQSIVARWAVFFPLNDDPEPGHDAPNAPRLGLAINSGWDILLHAYFLPTQDRQSIPGVTGPGSVEPLSSGNSEDHLRARWNRTLRDELLLPLVPEAVDRATEGLEVAEVGSLVAAIRRLSDDSRFGDAIWARERFLPVATEDGFEWRLEDSHRELREVAQWATAPRPLRKAWVAWFPESLVVLDGEQPRLSTDPAPWTLDEVKSLLDAVPTEALDTTESLEWLDSWLRHERSHAAPDDRLGQDRVLARWWRGRLADNDIPDTLGSGERRDDVRALQQVWRSLLPHRPALVAIDVPRDTRRPCQSVDATLLSQEYEIVLVPFGVPADRRLEPEDPTALLPVLESLGRAIAGNLDRSRPRLLLADALVGFLDSVHVIGALRSLPLIRGREHGKTVEPRDVPLTVTDLDSPRTAERLLFQSEHLRPDSEDEASQPNEELKGVASLLAKALDRRVVVVGRSALTVGTDLPSLKLDEVEGAVSNANWLSRSVDDRVGLLDRLLNSGQRCSLPVTRALATGWSVGEVQERTLLQTIQSQRAVVEAILKRLGRTRDLVPELVTTRFSATLLQPAGFVPADLGSLAAELAAKSGTGVEVDEPFSDGEAEALLGALPSDSSGWRALPIHRRWSDGARAPLSSDAARAADGFNPPEGLGVGELLVAPLPETSDRYISLPAADQSWLVERVLGRAGEASATDFLVGQDPKSLSKAASNALRTTQWVPTESGAPPLVAPEQVLFCPDSGRSEGSAWQRAVTALRECGGVGDVVFENELALSESQLKELQRHWSRRALEDIEVVIEHLQRAALGGKEWRVLPTLQLWSAQKETLLKLNLSACGRGWAFVAALLPLLSEADKHSTLERLIPKLVGEMTGAAMVRLLRVVEETYTSLDTSEGALYIALLETSSSRDDFPVAVLPHLQLMTLAGRKTKPSEIANVTEGVARSHLLAERLQRVLMLTMGRSQSATVVASASEQLADKMVCERLASYFEEARLHVEAKPVACFLNMLIDLRQIGTAEGKKARNELLHSWTGDHIEVHQEQCRQDLAEDRPDPVDVDHRLISDGDQIMHENLVGERRLFPTSSGESILAGPPVLFRAVWNVRLRKVNWAEMLPEDRRSWIKKGAHLLATTLPWLDEKLFADYWSHYAEGSQETITPTRNLIHEDLRFMLEQLRLGQDEHFRELIRKIAADVGQARSPDKIQRLKKDLAAKLSEGDAPGGAQQVVLEAIRKRIAQSSYSPESALFELFQNADDAYLDLGSHAGSFHVSRSGASGLDVRHWGRKINDTMGKRDTDWGRDLNAMLCAGLTSKTEDTSQGGAAPTGRFGLGFKAVYFLTDSPRIRSGELTLKVVAGLLPERVESMRDFPDVTDRPLQCTQLVLPPANDEQSRAQQKAFEVFCDHAFRLVAFAQRIRRIRIGPDAEIEFNDAGIDPDGTWMVQTRHLRWRPTALSGSTGAALLIPLDGRFSADVPTLWNVTPTREKWNLGYCINARFKLDPGRTRAEIDHPDTTRLLQQLGDQLGQDLCALHDCWSVNHESELRTIWDRLSTGLWQDDPSRRRFLRTLHGRGDDGWHRGLATWARERSIVPTGLSSPWRVVLPALRRSGVIYRISGALVHDDVLAALSQNAASLPVLVDQRVGETLTALGFDEFRTIKALDCLEVLAGEDLGPGVAALLADIAKEVVWNRLESDEGEALKRWRAKLRFKSDAGTFVSVRELLVGNSASTSTASDDDDPKEEVRRARLAPPENRLHSDYGDARLFRRIRGPLHAKAERIVDWLEAGHAFLEHVADYLKEGRLRVEVLREVRKRRRSLMQGRIPWAANLTTFRVTFGTGLVEQEHLLFLEQFVEPSSSADSLADPTGAPVSLRELWDLWQNVTYREGRLAEWHRQIYPRSWDVERLKRALGGADESEEREAWLLMMTLSLCMRIHGQLAQTRGALEDWMIKDYWKEIVAASEPSHWTDLMERMASERRDGDTKYLTWFGILPHIFVASRWFSEYREDLRNATSPGWAPQFTLQPNLNPSYQQGGLSAPSFPWAKRAGAWIVRELSRLGVIRVRKEHARHAYYSGAPVRRLLSLPGDSDAHAVYRHVEREVGPECASFHGCFDIPLYLEGYGPTSTGAATGGKVDR